MLKPMLAAAAAASLFALGACGQTTTVETDGPAENAAEDIGAAADRAGENIENAAENAGDEIEQAGDNAADAVDDATDGNPHTNP
jgi:hypothetical protein